MSSTKTPPFVIYNASAGSGKTYNLVLQYLQRCLQTDNPDTFKSILAITFTNKAANEMKARIIRALTSFKAYPNTGKDTALFKELLLILNLKPEALQKRSHTLLRSILHQYAAFSVSTIDRFTNRIIRTFATELHLSSNYEVELDTKGMLNEAIDNMLFELEEGSDTANVLIPFLNYKLSEGKSPRPKTGLLEESLNLMKEESFAPMALLKTLNTEDFLQIRNKLFDKKKKIEEGLLEKAKKLQALLQNHGLGKNHFSRNTVPSFLMEIIEKRAFNRPNVTLQKQVLGENNFYTAKAKADEKAAVDAIAETLRKQLYEIIAYVEEHIYFVSITKEILPKVYELAVLAEIERHLEIIKKDSNRLPIGEFNKLISERLVGQPAAFLYEKIGERYHHYFIDEFQDTSRLQWRNLLPLINNSMAQGGSTLLVGDGKQAIYRFRGGDVEQFLSIANDEDNSNKVMLQDKAVTLYAREALSLKHNYRSKAHIVDFNNSFFDVLERVTKSKGERAFTNTSYIKLYAEGKQLPQHKDGGYVCIQRFDNSDKEAYIEYQEQAILKIIEKALIQGYALKDIAVLTKQKKYFPSLLKFLHDNDIQAVSADSLLLSSALLVRGSVSLIQTVFNPADIEGRIDFLQCLWETKTISSFYEESFTFYKEWTAFTLLDLLDKLTFHFPAFPSDTFLSLSLSDKVASLSHLFGEDVLTDRLFQSFMDEIVAYERHNYDGEAGFLRWWKEKGVEVAANLPDDVDAVKVMTIHKSKGLEFPIVIVAFVDWNAFKLPRESDKVWLPLDESFEGLPIAQVGTSNADLDPKGELGIRAAAHNEAVALDNVNLLYVAFTRAEDRLYVLGSEQIRSDSIGVYLKTFIEEGAGEDLCFWESGEEQENLQRPKEKDNLFSLEYEREAWQNKLRVSSRAPKDWEGGETAQTSWGKKVHGLLGKIQYADEAEAVLQKMQRQAWFLPEEQEKVWGFVKGILEHTLLKKYFVASVKVLNEAEILVPQNTFRPDRVVFEGNTAHIIDYKTGVFREKDKKQVEHYQNLIADMGFVRGDKVLVYLQDKVEVIQW